MGKRFIKFRIFRAIPSFQSCRSKESSSAISANPVRSFLRLSSATTTASAALKSTHRPPTPPPKPHRSSLKRHISFLGSHFGPRSFPADSRTESSSSSSSRFRWGRDPKWHIIAKIPDYNNTDHSTPPRRKIYTSPNEDKNDVVLFPPLPLKNRRRRSFQKIRVSTSSDSGLFSDDDGNYEERENDDHDETDALVSTDSSTPRPSNASKINNSNNTQCGSRFSGAKIKRSMTTKKKRRSFKLAAEEEVAPARLSEFMRKMVPCRAVEGKVRESFAVVKKSENPYEDFKRSMAEMVVEKRMFEAAELEELLRCFLSLNSVHHHETIVRAFTEIWDALFSESSS